MGNTCFASASIQLLLSVYRFLQLGNHNAFSSVLNRTICDLQAITKTPLYPISLLAEVRKVSNCFNENSFQDAHEFLLSLVNNSNCDKFFISVITTLTCQNCKFSSQSNEQLLGIQLVVENNLVDSLALQFQDTEVDWDCSNCSESSVSHKSFTLIELPEVLLFHLKRFRSTQNSVKKIVNFFEFPLTNLQFHGQLYNLAAVVNHLGSVSSGHYNASICSDDQWFLCDDDKVSMIDSRSVVSSNAYLLAYRPV